MILFTGLKTKANYFELLSRLTVDRLIFLSSIRVSVHTCKISSRPRMAVRTSSMDDSTVASLSETSCSPEHTRERLATWRTRDSVKFCRVEPRAERCADTHPLDDVQQAAEVVRVAALGQVHQQLGGLLAHGRVAVVGDGAELRDDHCLDQLVLEGREGVDVAQ